MNSKMLKCQLKIQIPKKSLELDDHRLIASISCASTE